MPIPAPREKEGQAEYVERAHKALASEFPDTDKRNAIIFSTWRKAKGESEEEKKAHERFSDSEFQHIQDVPVFKEHAYMRVLRNKDGSPQLDNDGNTIQTVEAYDLKALKAITENCNRRVRETKDFAPLTGIHTGKRKPNGDFIQPEILGFGGPFRLGMYGNEERTDGAPYKGKWAIYQDEFWFKDKAHRAREMPRRSPEVYVGRPIESRFLDPITVLGAETPALDMGIHYHLNDKKELIERYSAPNITFVYSEVGKYDGAAAMPAPSNVSVPTEVKQKAHYDEDAEYSEDELAGPVQDVKDYHTGKIGEHENALKALKSATQVKDQDKLNKAIKKHTTHLNFHKRELDIINAHRNPATHPKNRGNELRATFQQAFEEVLVAQYSADPQTVNACVNAMMNTQIIKRIETFLDSQDAPVNPKEEEQQMLADEVVDIAQQQPTEESVEGKESQNPLAAENPPSAEGEEEEPDEGTEPASPNPGDKPVEKGNDMADSPNPPVDDKEKKEKYAFQEFQRETKVVIDDLKAKYDQQQGQIVKLTESRDNLLQERNAAVREKKMMSLVQRGYQISQDDMVKYSQSSEEVFQTFMDVIVTKRERIPFDSPTLFTPGLDIPEGTRPEVGQYGGAQASDVEQIVQYQQRKQLDGEYMSFDEAKDRWEEKQEKKGRKEAASA